MRRIGLIGFGSIGEHAHLPAWQALEDVEVTAVADVSAARRRRATQLLPQAELFDSPAELIGRASLDGVDICTPPNTHAELIVAACQRRIANIVCEKPLVLGEDEYRRVAQARQESGSRVISVNNWSHSDLNRHVCDALRSGAIGKVESIELRIGRPDCALGSEGWLPRWRTDAALAGGGIILDHGWHQLYLLLGWMRSVPESISAFTRTANARHYPVEDEAQIDLMFRRGRGRIELSWTAADRINSGRIEGRDGAITAHDDRVVIDGVGGRREVSLSSPMSQSSYHPEWFEATFRYNVLEDSRAPADRNFAEAGVLVSTICAAYRSAREQGAPHRPTFPTVELWNHSEAPETEVIDVRHRRGGPPA